jgi:hypothetical protein
MKSEKTLNDLMEDDQTYQNIYYRSFRRRIKGKVGREIIKKYMMFKNFPHLEREICTQILEAQKPK